VTGTAPAPGSPPLYRAGYSWRFALVLLCGMSAVMLLLYWPGVEKLLGIWTNSDTYAHGFLILPICLYLAWRRRAELAALQPRPGLWGLPVLALLGIAWLAARLVDVTVVQTFVVVALLPALALTLLGTTVARVLMFPLGYLFFAWPVGSFLIPLLQDHTAWMAVHLIRLSGVPVHMEGRFISIPGGNFIVAEVCSGINYLMASVALITVYSYLIYRSLWRRLALIAFTIFLSVIANGVRVYGVIMLAHWTDMEHGTGADHVTYGQIFFVLVMVLVFWIGGLFRERRPADGTDPAVAAAVPTMQTRAGLATAACAVVVMALGPAGDGWLSWRAGALDTALVPVAAPAQQWSGPGAPADDWLPRFLDPDHVVRAGYRREDGVVVLYLLHYRHEGDGRGVIAHANRMLGPRDDAWRRLSESRRRIRLDDGALHRVREMELRRHDGTVRRIVWYWYQVAGIPTTEPVAVKLLEAWARLRGDPEGSLLVAVSSDYLLSPDEARERLGGFIADAGPLIRFRAGDGAH
jgi:exosortase A